MGDGQTDVVSLWETLAMGEQNLLVSAGSAPAPNSISCISTAYHENQIFGLTITFLPACWTPSVLGHMRGTLSLNRSLFLHALIVAKDTYQLCKLIKATYEPFLIILSKKYVVIAASAQNLRAVFFSCLTALLRCSTM
jgi:hypothetical protein